MVGRELETVIRAFQADVARAVDVLESNLGTKDRAEQRSLVKARGGYADAAGEHRCAFHGAGCRLQLSRDRFIDWDYGHDGRIDGFDLWRLANFLRSRRKLLRILPIDELEGAFERALVAGVIVKHPHAQHDHLFYLRQDLEPKDDA